MVAVQPGRSRHVRGCVERRLGRPGLYRADDLSRNGARLPPADEPHRTKSANRRSFGTIECARTNIDGDRTMSPRAMTLASALAVAQNAGPSPHGQVPGPNATQAGTPTDGSPPPAQAQPVPGAMAGSDDVPSTISDRNARDDELPTAAYRLKNLTDAQRQLIYRSVVSGRAASRPGQPPAGDLKVGMALPLDAELNPLPDSANVSPTVKDLHYQLIGDTLVLVDPLYRQVL